MDHEDALERQLVRAAGGSDRTARVVHIGQWLEQRDARSTRAGAPLAQTSAVTLARAPELPAPREQLRDGEADVVACLLELATGIAEPDDEPVRRGAAAREPQTLLGALAALASGARVLRAGIGGSLATFADDLRLELDLALVFRPQPGRGQRRDDRFL